MLAAIARGAASRIGATFTAQVGAIAAASSVAGTKLQPARSWDDGVEDGFKAVTADELFKIDPRRRQSRKRPKAPPSPSPSPSPHPIGSPRLAYDCP
mmetsp:Transcript_37858/g.96931  ORF Transcript_37858/g.96931 Transcript_37858/m.96931 type:complete len:97 (-) Transcript_37858:643-933(-)